MAKGCLLVFFYFLILLLDLFLQGMLVLALLASLVAAFWLLVVALPFMVLFWFVPVLCCVLVYKTKVGPSPQVW